MARRQGAWHHRPMKSSPAYLWIFVPGAIVTAWSTIDFASRGLVGFAAIGATACILMAVCVGLLLGSVLRKLHAT
jgi:hypothetical protein